MRSYYNPSFTIGEIKVIFNFLYQKFARIFIIFLDSLRFPAIFARNGFVLAQLSTGTVLDIFFPDVFWALSGFKTTPMSSQTSVHGPPGLITGEIRYSFCLVLKFGVVLLQNSYPASKRHACSIHKDPRCHSPL